MRVIARAASLVVMAALALCGTAAHARGAQIVAEKPLDGGGVELTIETSAFAAPTRVEVFLPDGYDADPKRRWPVTYYLHGAQGDQARFAAWFGDLIGEHPSIVVAPDGGQFGFYSDWHNGGAGGPPMYETYFIDQLIPLIDARFRTTADRAGRALIGESMGGYGVMSYAARHPDLFAAAASLSGLLDSEDPAAIALISGAPATQGGAPEAIYGSRVTEEVRWRGHNPTDLADNLRDVDLQVRTAEGAPNPVVDGADPSSAVGCATENVVFRASTDFHERLLTLGVPHLWHNYGAGCHSIPMFRRELTDSLPGLESAFANPRPAPRTFSYRSIEPSFDVWDWRIDADPERPLEFLQLSDANRRGLTLTGSGTTRVSTPPFYRGLKAVDVVGSGTPETLAPDRRGRLRFTMDLGPPNGTQQYTPGAITTETSVTTSFEPHPILRISRARATPRRLHVCARALGGPITTRMRVVDAEDRVAIRRAESTVRSKTACRALRWTRRPSGTKGTLVVNGEDRFGHAVRSRRTVRLPSPGRG